MTKKDYINLADTIRLCRGDIKNGLRDNQLYTMMVSRFAVMLKLKYPNFDDIKFIGYCKS